MTYATGHFTPSHLSLKSLMRGVEEWISLRLAAYDRSRELRRAEAYLRSLSDRELDDIGVARGDIHDAVWYGLPRRY